MLFDVSVTRLMTADSRAKVQGRSSARDFRAVQVAAGMDGDAHSRPPDRRYTSTERACGSTPENTGEWRLFVVLSGLQAVTVNCFECSKKEYAPN
ncbi:hypothetical protein cypCar_00036286 [Cyprinus carpio]|nr:hypothetical protein cypCar_00036286 [Cyprinus carpio]